MTDVTLLDGGMGQELIRRSGDAPTPLWSTQVMLDRPGLVADVHRAYFEAGAMIATANTYAIHRDRLVNTGLEAHFEDLHHRALSEAEAARDSFGSGRIAGAIGPLIASYRPDIHPDATDASPRYAEVARLMHGRVDLVICETVASLEHARGVLRGAAAADVPVWLAITVDDEDGNVLRSGEQVSEIPGLAQNEGAAAILINCSAPEAIPAALSALGESALPIGAYANGFTQISKAFLKENPTVDVLEARRDMTPDVYATHAQSWIGQGATIVGGCCETGPDHIAEIARRLAVSHNGA